jgi:anaerobic selenocysteine-containing dehydrogenase
VALRTIYEAPRVDPREGETVVTSTCGHNCGGRCVVNAHVVDGRITKISTDPRKWTFELPPLHACVRGFGQVERVYHPDRLKQPLRRTGPRGSGRFEPISWDAALDEVAREMLRIRDAYGNAAILDASRSGNLSMLHNRTAAQRFLYMFGGCTELWSNMSAEAEIFAVHMTYGAKAEYKSAGREPTDYLNSKLIVMWGWSPGDGTFGTNTLQYLKWAKKQGVRIVCVDPRQTRSSRDLADEHVFIRPSTDAAALIAMAYVIASEGLQDQAYCDRYVLGFDEDHLPPDAPVGSSYRSYLLGLADGVRKTPEWAAEITGIPAETIRRLAVEFATSKPAALQGGYAPGPNGLRRAVPPRRVRARRHHRQRGHRGRQLGHEQRRHRTLRHQEPARRSQPDRRARVVAAARRPPDRGQGGRLSRRHQDGLLGGGRPLQPVPQREQDRRGPGRHRVLRRPGPLPHPDRPLRRHRAACHDLLGAQRRAHAVGGRGPLRDLHEAGHRADVRVPERHRHLRRPRPPRRHPGLQRQDGDRVAARADAGRYRRLRHLHGQGPGPAPRPEDAVAFAREIREPDRYKFTTPSGKIEVYSMALAANPDPYGLGRIPPIPTWIPPVEADPRHPLQLCTPKSRARTHSIHGNQEVLARADRDDVWLHTADAAARGIADGQRVRVFNDRGATVLPAKVTDRIAPGVVSIREGAWFTPDERGDDRKGCANVLTDDRSAPCGATTYNTCLVQVEAAPEQG